MTTIAGIETPQGVILAGDSMARLGEDNGFIADVAKVWRTSDYVFGYCGGFRLGQAFKYYLSIPDRKPYMSIEEWISTDVVQDMREAMERAGVSNGSDEWALLFGVGQELWMIDGAMGASRSMSPFNAIGSGSSWALGSLHTTYALNLTVGENEKAVIVIDPEARLTYALTSTAHYHYLTAPPYTFATNYKETSQPDAKIHLLRQPFED